MLRFLAGILVVQVASIALVVISGIDPDNWRAWLPIAFALGMISLVAAFWFSTLAAGMRRDALERQRSDFASERENLRVKAEKEKMRLLRKGQKDMASATQRVESRANRKVTYSVVAASAIGVFMMAASFVTVGMLLLAGAGGTAAGYVAGRRGWTPKLPGSGSGGGKLERLSSPRRWLRDRTSVQGRE